MDEYTQKVSLENFKKFVNGLSVLSMYLDDIDLRAGKVRQATADKTTLLAMDFSKIFPKDLCIAGIKPKLTLLELIIDDENNDITIQANDKFWFVSNSKTIFKFAWASSERLTTSYLPDDKYKIHFEDLTTPEMVLYTINMQDRSDVHKKIKKVCDTFNSDKILLNIDKDKIEMKVESIDKKNDAVIFKDENKGKIASNYAIIVRSTFIDKLDTKTLGNVIFYDASGTKSITKATSLIETDLVLDIFTYSKCDKS